MHIATNQELELQLPPRERRWFRLVRLAGWSIAGVYFLAALAVLALRFMVLPNVDDYTDRIAGAATDAIGRRVTIGAITAAWHGLHPRFELSEVRIFDARGEEALRLPRVALTVAWRSVAYGRPVFGTLLLDSPDLHIRRAPDGRLFVAGLAVEQSDERSPGIAATVLGMRELLVRNATVQWQDELRQAAPLKLEQLDFMLLNSGKRHRFALSAVPPPAFAAPLDVRGELIGRSIDELADWDGRVYAASDFIDLSVWRSWVDYPIEVGHGRGAVRMWSTLRDWRPTDVVADLSLAEVTARLAPDLPPLELASVSGRIGAREVVQGFEFIASVRKRRVAYEAFGRKLGLETRSGASFAPADFDARWDPGGEKSAAQGSVAASAIELEPLALVAEALPLPRRIRHIIDRMAPRGRLADFTYAWKGGLDEPSSFSAHARFSQLGVQAYEQLPGGSGLAGIIDLSDKSGRLSLDSAHATIDYPYLFAEPWSALDSLSGKLAWARTSAGVEVTIERAGAANADASVTLSGSYRSLAAGPGYVDLVGKIARLDGRAVYRYIPHLRPSVAQWLKTRLTAQATEGRLRLKGDLRQFPFDDPKDGVFEIAGKISGGALAYADGWPPVEAMQGGLVLSGRKLEVKASKAALAGLQLGPVTASLPQLFGGRPLLAVTGQAEGATQDFLQLIAQSPLREYTHHALDGWTAEGRGKLALELDLPLDDLGETRVNGNYQLAGNRIAMGFGDEPLAQVNGRVDFTKNTAETRNLSAQWLGGPLAAQVATRPDGAVVMSAQATANVAGVLRNFRLPGNVRASGAAPYRFTALVRGAELNQVVESTLQGVSIDLPPPLGKAAADNMPLRVERNVASQDGAAARETIALRLGAVLNAQMQLRREGGSFAVERAGVGIGETVAALPERSGVFVSTNLKTLDLDRFLALARGEGGPAALELAAFNVRAGELIVLGRRFNEVTARAVQVSPGRWQTSVDAREVAGEIGYGTDGKGTVVAELKRLIQPDAVPATTSNPTLDSLPAISLSAERYVYNGHELGRLDLRAVNERRGWRLDQAMLSSADCTFKADGLWQPPSAGTAARAAFDFTLTAPDAGKCLARVGYPETVARATAKLEGKVNWSGPPYAIDYPTLSGAVALDAAQGQFVKLKPGLGKLLGVLSLQSLPRRISLDFRDVFSDGFAFDRLHGTADIVAGVMRTEDLTMAGPAATVAMNGRADLARETQDLHVRVVPVVGDSAAVGVALLNPIIGAGIFLAQRLLRDPIGQLFSFEYHITGGWDDPKVKKVRAPKAAETTPEAPAGN